MDPRLAGGEEELVAEACRERRRGAAGRRCATAPPSQEAAARPPRPSSSATSVGGRTYAIVFIMLLYGPLVLLAVFSFNDSIVFSLPWSGFTTKWYAAGAVADANLRRRCATP